MARAFATALPTPRTSLLGRDREIAAVRRALLHERAPLLTLTGPGGVGKTRLALAVAAELETEHADGVVFVPLADVRDANLVLPTIARALGLRESPEAPLAETLATVLRGQELLLVVDNVEQVAAAAPDLANLLEASPPVQILATSRVRLRVSAEYLHPISPLPVPGAADGFAMASLTSNPAVALFTQRARQVQPEFELTPQNAPNIAAIVSHLDGLPLAIELAAARVAILSPEALLARLDRRLRLLTGGPHDMPPRLQSMADAIAWSYELLDPAQQTLLRRLSVFVGGFDTEAVIAVADEDAVAALDALRALADHSLVQRMERHGDEAAIGGGNRFVMLETVREFGLARLEDCGETHAARRAHATWRLALAERAEPELLAANQAQWFAYLDVELGNMRAALEWSHIHDHAMALRLATALTWYWYYHGSLAEGRMALERALATAALPHDPVRALALAWAAGLAQTQGDFTAAQPWVDRALALSTELAYDAGIAYALHISGIIACETDAQGDTQTARGVSLVQQALEIYRSLDNHCWIGGGFGYLAGIALRQGDLDRAEALANESNAVNALIGGELEIAAGVVTLGEIAEHRGEFDSAMKHYEAALATFRRRGDRANASIALSNMARLKANRGDVAGAVTHWQASARLALKVGDMRRSAEALEGLASLAVGTKPESAVRLLAAAAWLHDEVIQIGHDVSASDSALRLRAALGDTFDAMCAAGWAESTARAITEALSLQGAQAPNAIGPTSLSARTGPMTLTSREQDVLALLTAGMTDRQFAETLFISRKTASNHVASILAKLGVETRSAAAAKATRDGLL